MRLAQSAIAGMFVLLVAGCASGEAPPPRRAAGGGAPPPVVIRPLFAADYMAAASSIDLYEIRSAELALSRANAPAHRQFAQSMIIDHRGTSAQLSLAGRRLNLLPSATLLPMHQAMFDELVASGDFDAAYHRQQIAVHEAALKLHSDFAARGQSPTLRAVARNAAPIERRHLAMMRRM
jgi:putative membrane protein